MIDPIDANPNHMVTRRVLLPRMKHAGPFSPPSSTRWFSFHPAVCVHIELSLDQSSPELESNNSLPWITYWLVLPVLWFHFIQLFNSLAPADALRQMGQHWGERPPRAGESG